MLLLTLAGPAGGEVRVIDLAMTVIGKVVSAIHQWPFFTAKADGSHPGTPAAFEARAAKTLSRPGLC